MWLYTLSLWRRFILHVVECFLTAPVALVVLYNKVVNLYYTYISALLRISGHASEHMCLHAV